MRFLSTKIHGVLDYLSVLVFFLLPRWLEGESATTAMLFQVAGLMTLLSSLMTRYELGLLRALPMAAHLVLDFLIGATFLTCGFLLPNESQTTRNFLIGLGIFCIGAALMTKTQMAEEEKAANLDAPSLSRRG
jgi:hypothetical protein